MMQDIEIQRLREQIAQMQEEIEHIRNDIYDAPREEDEEPNQNAVANVPAPQAPAIQNEVPWYAPRRMGRAMNWMYDVAQAHAIVRNFGWAVTDGAQFVGFAGGCAMATARRLQNSPMAKKAVDCIKENPKVVGAVVATGAVVALAERATRYEDENGETKHRCAIL
jgi:hypothetical protein